MYILYLIHIKIDIFNHMIFCRCSSDRTNEFIQVDHSNFVERLQYRCFGTDMEEKNVRS